MEKINKLDEETRKYNKDSAELQDWFTAKTKEIELTRMLYALKLEYNKLQQYDSKIEKLKSESQAKTRKKKWKNTDVCDETKPEIETTDEEELVLEDGADILPQSQSDEEDEDEDKKYEPIKVFTKECFCNKVH